MFTDLIIPAGRRPMTRNEARVSFIVGTVFTLMIGAEIFSQYSSKSLSVVFFFVFWVPMLVLHELGHAVVAKMLGWKVREIVIGFGRDLFEWQIGETRVKIKLAPVEGYVLPAPVKPDQIRIKSMLVYAAGPGAELALLAILIAVFGWDTVFNESEDLTLIALKSLAFVILFGAGFNLLPFRTEGAASDGLGIISSPFMSDEFMELRLVTFELREGQKMILAGNTQSAVELLGELLAKYPDNDSLQLVYVDALSANHQLDRARDFVSKKLSNDKLHDHRRLAWLLSQATVELDAEAPSYLVLDLAIQSALAIAPGSPDLLGIKGASLVRRGRCEEGGNMLADAWRKNDSKECDAQMLAYLTIAAFGCRNKEAAERFRDAFGQVNKSEALRRRLDKMTVSAR